MFFSVQLGQRHLARHGHCLVILGHNGHLYETRMMGGDISESLDKLNVCAHQ